MVEYTFTGSNLTAMATSLVQVIESKKLQCYDDEDGRLRRDFGKFNIVEKTYGLKLEAVSDEFGHADVGTALAMVIPAGVDMLNGVLGLQPEDDLVELNPAKLSEEEIEELPQELKDIYGMETNVGIEYRRNEGEEDPDYFDELE